MSFSFLIKSVKENIRRSTASEGSLKPFLELISGHQLQAALLAFLPTYFLTLKTGNMTIDMFLLTCIVTFVMSMMNMVGSTIKEWVEGEDEETKEQDSLSVLVDFLVLDKWGDPGSNIHWTALAWFISLRSKEHGKGDFRMVLMGDDYEIKAADSDEFDMPAFNILPSGDEELKIEYEGSEFTVKFDQVKDSSKSKNSNNDDGDGGGGGYGGGNKILRNAKMAEAPIIVTLNKGPQISLEFMQKWIESVTQMFLKNQNSKKSRARFERPASRGYWYRMQNLISARGVKSVALDRKQEEILLRDLETFHSDRDFYRRMGLPYRRGYLLSGRPGTGKTSLINAISATYNRDLYYINLKEITDDNALQSAFSNVPKDGIIVFEDIDAQSGEVHSRDRRFALKQMERAASKRQKEAERAKKLAKKKREAEKKRQKEEAKKKKKEEEELKKKKKKASEDNEDDGDDEEEDVEVSNDSDASSSDSSEEENDEEEDTTLTNDGSSIDVSMDLSDSFGMFGGMGGGFGGFGSSFGGGSGGFGGLNVGAGTAKLFSGFSLSMLLNCLDGHMLNDNIIIIMTSNHPEVLDPALIRPGRIDLHLELGFCTRYQLTSMYRTVMNDVGAEMDGVENVPEGVIAPCDALRIMLLYRSEPEKIVGELLERADELQGRERGDRGSGLSPSTAPATVRSSPAPKKSAPTAKTELPPPASPLSVKSTTDSGLGSPVLTTLDTCASLEKVDSAIDLTTGLRKRNVTLLEPLSEAGEA
jgi:uncharacterized membrane protein YgcG